MTADVSGFVKVAVDGAGKAIDASVVTTDAAVTAYRQRINVSDVLDDLHARVKNTSANLNDEGVVVRLISDAYLAGIRDSVSVRHDPDEGPLWVTQADGQTWCMVGQGKDQRTGSVRDVLTDAAGRQIVAVQDASPPTLGTIVAATGQVAAPLYGCNSAVIMVGDAGNTAFAGLNFRVDASFDGGATWATSLSFGLLSATTAMTGLAASGVIANQVGGRVYVVNCPGATNVRAQATAWTSGRADVRIQPVSGSINSGSTTVAGTVTVSGTATTTGVGTTPTMSQINSAATTNATSVKATAGTVYNVLCSNSGGAAAFVKFFNKASAPTLGTDVPVFTVTVPADGHALLGFDLVGQRFSLGIALAITNLVADADTTAVAAAQVKVSTAYI